MKFLLLLSILGFAATAPNQHGKSLKSTPLTMRDIILNMKNLNHAKGAPLWEVNLNPWWDQFFVGYKNYMEFNGGDAFALPEISYSFEQKFGLITFRGSMGWYDGVMKGMETLHRTAPASLRIQTVSDDPAVGDGLQLMFNGGLGVDFLSANYYGKVTWMDIAADADVTLDINEFYIDFDAKFQTDCTFALENFVITPGRIKVTVTDVPWPLDTIMERVAEIGLNVFKTGFVNAVEIFIRDFLAKHLLKDLATALCEEKPPCGRNATMSIPKFEWKR